MGKRCLGDAIAHFAVALCAYPRRWSRQLDRTCIMDGVVSERRNRRLLGTAPWHNT